MTARAHIRALWCQWCRYQSARWHLEEGLYIKAQLAAALRGDDAAAGRFARDRRMATARRKRWQRRWERANGLGDSET